MNAEPFRSGGSLDAEWREFVAIAFAQNMPSDEVLVALKPVFFSGAKAVLDLVARGTHPSEVAGEVIAYAHSIGGLRGSA